MGMEVKGQQLSAAALISLRLSKHKINPFCMQNSLKNALWLVHRMTWEKEYTFLRELFQKVMELLQRKRKTSWIQQIKRAK